MYNETGIDFLALIKNILDNIVKIIIITFIFGIAAFSMARFVLPKSYTSYTDFTIISNGESIDYSSYLRGNVVLDKVGSKYNIDTNSLDKSITVIRDVSNQDNYRITVTTNNPVSSCKIANDIVKVFNKELKEELDVSGVTISSKAEANFTPESPDVKRVTLNGCLLGFLLSLSLTVLRFVLYKYFRNAEEVESYLGVDVLGIIPQVK